MENRLGMGRGGRWMEDGCDYNGAEQGISGNGTVLYLDCGGYMMLLHLIKNTRTCM